MRIQNLQFYTPQVPSFTAWKREVWEDNKILHHRNDTSFYRDDMDWNQFANYLKVKYQNVDKVNVYDYACSDGSEVYTMIISMFNNMPSEQVAKFMPIKALDFDKVAIERAKNKKIDMSPVERLIIKANSKYGVEPFFEFDPVQKIYKPTKLLTENVEFKHSDITKDYKHIKPDNTIVMARNFWPYMANATKFELAKNLYNQLGKNSIVVIGEYDTNPHFYEYGVDIILAKVGFRPTFVKNVMEKV